MVSFTHASRLHVTDLKLCAAVIEYYGREQDWSPELVTEQIINVYNKNDVSNFSELDLTSIMMYVVAFLLSVCRSLTHKYVLGTSCQQK